MMVEPASVVVPPSFLDTPPISPRKRKGVPTRSPKASCDSDLTAVFIKFPFLHPAQTLDVPDKRSRMDAASPQLILTEATDPNTQEPSEKISLLAPLVAARVDSSTSEAESLCQPSGSPVSAVKVDKANVRFVGDSFYGSNRYWWTRTTRPSPAISSASSDDGSPPGGTTGAGDDKDEFEAGNLRPDTFSGERSSPGPVGRGRGRGRGRGGRGRGRGRGNWKKL
ncbi:hypothetical protein BC830DRAFT_1134042 [Chytriomyces sp. MP71]|nr:hypothetical protein BC830DRAFT_1134042 [Chytriomyces sp. MP71]